MTGNSQRARNWNELEDEEDYRIAVVRLKEDLPPIPLVEVVRQLDLGDLAGELKSKTSGF